MRVVLVLVCLLLVGLANAQAKLRFWAVCGTDRDVELYRGLAQDFERQSGIKVEVTPLAWGNFETKYLTAMAAGLPPDVGLTNLGGPTKYGAIGGLLDLRELEKASPGEPLEAAFSPAMMPMMQSGERLYGIPYDLTCLTLFYRKDILEKIGITQAPKTWSELNRAIDQVEAAGYKFYFGWLNGQQWSLSMFTSPYGVNAISTDKDGSPQVNWQDSRYQEGVFQALKFWFCHDSPGRDLDSRIPGMFSSQKTEELVPLMAHLHFIGSQLKTTHPELNGKWATAPWPTADGGTTTQIMGGTALVVFRETKDPVAALKWVRYLNSVPAQQKFLLDRISRGKEANFSVSPVKAVYDPKENEFWSRPEFKGFEADRPVISETVQGIRTQPSVVGADVIGRLEQNLVDRMQSFITARYDATAGKKGMNRSQLIRHLAAGKDDATRASLEAEIRAQLKKEYAQATPEAQKVVRAEQQKYRDRYGEIIANVDAYRRQRTVLDYGKWVLGAFVALAVLAIGLAPKLRKHWRSYLFISVPLLLAATFVFLPAVAALYLSFTEYHPVLPLSTARFNGIENYRSAIESGEAAASFSKTAFYALVTVPIGIVLSLVLAYQLSLRLGARKLVQFIYFSPMVTSVVSIALIFTQLFLSGKEGWVNAILLKLGIVRDPVQFLLSEQSFPYCVMVLAIWHGLAFTILIFLSGLRQVPGQLYEAAQIDGATRTRQFWHIAIPGIRPQMFFVTILGVIGAFQVFETIYLMAGKSENAGAKFGPNGSALTVVPWLYNTAFENFEMGKASAIAYMLFALLLVLTAIQFGGYRKKEQAS